MLTYQTTSSDQALLFQPSSSDTRRCIFLLQFLGLWNIPIHHLSLTQRRARQSKLDHGIESQATHVCVYVSPSSRFGARISCTISFGIFFFNLVLVLARRNNTHSTNQPCTVTVDVYTRTLLLEDDNSEWLMKSWCACSSFIQYRRPS